MFRSDSSSLRRRFFRLTALNILANITAPLAGLVDVAMLGHLAEIRFLAGVALAGAIFDVVYWTFGFLRMGTTGTTAQALGRMSAGQDDGAEVGHILYRGLVLAGVISLLLVAAREPLGDLAFSALSGDPEVEAAGREYYDARILGAPAVLLSLVLLGWFLGREESRLVLVMTAIANLCNIGLNYVFIIQLDLAARGAGLATMWSQYVMLAVALWLFARRRSNFPWRWPAILDPARWREMAGLNRDILIRTLFLVGSFALFTNFSSILGVAALAANTLLLRIVTLAAFLIDGAAFATESLAGVFYGTRQRGELRQLLRLSLASAVVFSVPIFTLVALAPRWVLGLLTSHPGVIEFGVTYRLWLIPVMLFGAPAYIYDGLFLGLTAGRPLRNAMFVSSVLVFLPIALTSLYLSNPHLLWLALTGFMAARAITLEFARRGLPSFASPTVGEQR